MEKPAISFPILGDFEITAPNYIEIGNFKIYWYGVIIALGFALALFYCLRRCSEFGITKDNMYDTVLIAVPAALVGCRIYYVMFNWADFKDNLLAIFDIRSGGLGMYGGIILAALMLLIYTKKKKISILALLDLCAFGLLIGQIVGRWGNFMNRECFGSITDVPWKMGLTSNGVTTYVHPTFLYESLWNLLGLILLHFFSKKHRKFDGQIFALYAAWYGIARALLEILRSAAPDTDSLFFFGTGIPSSMIVGVLCVIGAVIFLNLNTNKTPDGLFVNRLAAAAAEAAPQEPAEADDIEDAEKTDAPETQEERDENNNT